MNSISNQKTKRIMQFSMLLVTLLLPSIALAHAFHVESPYLDIEYLIWKPFQEGPTYSLLSDNFNVDAGIPITGNTVPVNPRFRWSSGCKIGVGVPLCHSWSGLFEWTHFNQNDCDNISRTTNGNVFLVDFFEARSLTGAATATNNWRLKFNTLDIDFAPCLSWECNSITIDPYLGIKVGHITQHNCTTFGDVATLISPYTIFVKKDNRFAAAGPHAGAYLTWDLNRSFKLFTNASAALLLGKNCFSTLYFLADTFGTFNPTLSNNQTVLRPTAQIQLGGMFTPELCRHFDFELFCAFEAQYWWHNTQDAHSIFAAQFSGTQYLDLALYGFNIGFRFHF